MEPITSSLEGARLVRAVDIWSNRYNLRVVNCPSKAYLFTDGQQWEIVVCYPVLNQDGWLQGDQLIAKAVGEKLEPLIYELVRATEAMFNFTDFAVWLFYRNWSPDSSMDSAKSFEEAEIREERAAHQKKFDLWYASTKRNPPSLG